MKRIRAGLYLYRDYRVMCLGYYPPEKRVVWEASDLKDGHGAFHAFSKRQLKYIIDQYHENNQNRKYTPNQWVRQ